ncbi:type II secretion system minor pseudopilin GspJ [Citrobacter amalonaticus]|uniref:type II secretion system minor pseudopilin GspJ n=1 Tax=Citrobacter amalonaticus TaxID=35703 RepID=UPI00300D1A1F
MSKRQRQQGFTLLEIMIALAIFAVISILAWQILDGAMRTSTASDQAATKVTALQRTYNLLSRDFYQLQARAPRNNGEVFVQQPDALELTTLNGISGQVQLERVRWTLKDKRLWRNVWAAIDGPANAKPEEVPILSDVKTMTWRFWDEGWQDKWTDSSHQPDGVELNLIMENGETWRWVFMTPGDMPDAQPASTEASADPAQPATENAAQPVTNPQADAAAQTGDRS